jgi:hypothetical protein
MGASDCLAFLFLTGGVWGGCMNSEFDRATMDKYFGTEAATWTDVLTVVSANPSRGVWWTRPDQLPWLPVLVHVTCLRASGRKSAMVGDRFGANILWRPEREATAYHLFRDGE